MYKRQLLRYLFGFTGEALVRDAVGSGASRSEVEAIVQFIETNLPQ